MDSECRYCNTYVNVRCKSKDEAYNCSMLRGETRAFPEKDHKDKVLPMQLELFPELPPNDPIDPKHYSRFAIQPIEFITKNKMEFWQGNVIKYTCRYDMKGGVEDLKKARRYLDEKINELEGTKK